MNMETLVYYYPEGHQAHASPGHPEHPGRVEALRQALQAAGWWDAFPKVEPDILPGQLLEQVHSPSYLVELQQCCRSGAWLDMDTYTTPASWQLALNAAGGAVAAAREVWGGASRRGLALTRPPGHHATRQRGMGFCLINNVAVAAQALIQFPAGGVLPAERLAIVDLDLHHGNGTQDIFWDRGDVLYISTHQSPFYPGTGRIDERGAGAGLGCTANIPLPPFTGDQGFAEVMESLILPLLERYQPQMVLVSLGFDSHWRDPLGYLNLSAHGFGELVSSLVEWAVRCCAGKMALFLEGGYDLPAGQACIQAAVAALLGEPFRDPLGVSPRAETTVWQEVIQSAKVAWNL